MNWNPNRAFLDQAIALLKHDFFPKIRAAVSMLTPEQVWWRPNPSSNSIGNLLLHLSGNVRQWILSGLGNIPDLRERNYEFRARDDADPRELLDRLEKTVEEASQLLGTLTAADLQTLHRIQIYDVSGMQAIFHVVEHFSCHTGQILYITKLLTDKDLGFYSQLDGD